MSRFLLVTSHLVLLALFLYSIWKVAQKWNRLDKHDLLSVLRKTFETSDSSIYLAILLATVGVLFFLFKKHHQFWYGLFEIYIALIGCAITAQAIRGGFFQNASTNTILFQGFGAVYLLVRGLSNVDEGRRKPAFWYKGEYERYKEAYRGWQRLEQELIKKEDESDKSY